MIASDRCLETDYEGEGKCPLESVVLSNQLEEIPSEMFWCARKLTSITIPSSVTSIERDAFEGCSDLRTINYTGSQEDWEKITIHER